MRRAFRNCCLAPLLPLLASAALAQGGPPHDGGLGAPDKDDIGMVLRLADGTVVRVSDGVADRGLGGAYGATLDGIGSASANTGPRRATLRRRTEIFDPQTPGAVASIRG
jgi:hypothetical protein